MYPLRRKSGPGDRLMNDFIDAPTLTKLRVIKYLTAWFEPDLKMSNINGLTPVSLSSIGSGSEYEKDHCRFLPAEFG